MPGAGNSQAWDRYAYVLNNPLRYTDPTGHMMCEICPGEGGDGSDPSDPPPPPDPPLPDNDNDGDGGGGGNGEHPLPVPLPVPDSGSDDLGEQLLPASYLNSYTSSYCGNGPNGLYNFLDCGANLTQDLALLIDAPFAALEVVLIVAGCFAGLQGCAAGAAAGIAVFNVSGANIHESYISAASAFLSIFADLADDGRPGESSAVAATAVILGSLSPDPIVDFAIDGFGSAYNHDVQPISEIPSLIGSLFNR